MFSLLIHASGQLESFLPPWYMRIYFNQLISFNVIYGNLRREISNLLSRLHAITRSSDTMSYNFGKVYVFKKVRKDHFSFTMIKKVRIEFYLD